MIEQFHVQLYILKCSKEELKIIFFLLGERQWATPANAWGILPALCLRIVLQSDQGSKQCREFNTWLHKRQEP